jgi:glycosyltransferase involved in cell wall biosynthesis
VTAVGQVMAEPPVRPERRLRILVLSWHYPTPATPQRGLWVERMCDVASDVADVRVIVPTPWVPPLVPIEAISRFRRVPARERRGSVELHFPRIPGSIEYFTHNWDPRLALPSVLATARRLHRESPFDLIHAHFIYPDGVVAAEVGRALGIPVMTSEHAFWLPWLVDHPKVGRQVRAALPRIAVVTAVSDFLRQGIDAFVNGAVDTAVLPNVIDDRIFRLTTAPRNEDELLYVGLIRRVKRVDVLLRAFAEVRSTMPNLRLRILSANAFRTYARDRAEMRSLISSLGLDSVVEIEHGVSPEGVAEAMRRCAFVAISSTRRETFCSVAAEAMACGTPLIVTRCGGPEEFVTADDGVMVDADDPAAFAQGIRDAIARRSTFDGAAIHDRIVARFGRDAWSRRALAIYERVAARGVSTAP